jgi:hypothetical protein
MGGRVDGGGTAGRGGGGGDITLDGCAINEVLLESAVDDDEEDAKVGTEAGEGRLGLFKEVKIRIQ